jgi:UDP-N-acetylmuramate--alanine ligase
VNLQSFNHIYFLGIGGIGMSALARWFCQYGYQVAGYDKTATTLTEALEVEGIAVHFEDDVQQIPENFRQNPSDCLVVYTPAVPQNHSELLYFQNKGFTLLKRSQVLGLLTQNLFTIAVAGTHGKTTTSSMVAHILTAAGKNCTAFLGGITQNYNTNLLFGDPNSAEKPMVVVEADEFDRSFLTLYPDLAIVNSVDADHLDIYGNHDAIKESFNAFVRQIKPGGKLFMKKDLPLELPASTRVQTFNFSIEKNSAYEAQNVRIENEHFVFDLRMPDTFIEGIQMKIPGFHNIENATAAAAIALEVGIATSQIKQALFTFTGVKRRFEYVLKNDNIVFIDDYAHHPAEIEAFIRSVRALYPTRKITAIFQPHLYSRTRDFAEGFAESLSLADQLVLLDIYPARELPIPGITSEIIFEKTNLSEKALCTKKDLLGVLQSSSLDVVLTLGAGDIDQCIAPIKEWLQSR